MLASRSLDERIEELRDARVGEERGVRLCAARRRAPAAARALRAELGVERRGKGLDQLRAQRQPMIGGRRRSASVSSRSRRGGSSSPFSGTRPCDQAARVGEPCRMRRGDQVGVEADDHARRRSSAQCVRCGLPNASVLPARSLSRDSGSHSTHLACGKARRAAACAASAASASELARRARAGRRRPRL